MRRTGVFAVAAWAGLAAGTAAAGPLDAAALDANPCRFLPGFERTDTVAVSRFDVQMRREMIFLAAEGDLSCGAAGAGSFGGNLTLRAKIDADIDASTCAVEDITVALANLGGTAAATLAPRVDETETALEGALTLLLGQQCRRLIAP